jgi:hypothetical protein
MTTMSERREARRFPIRVLVRCLPPGVPVKRNGHETKGWEMWAKDLGNDGVGLEWSRRWAMQRCPSCSLGISTVDRKKRELCLCSSPEKSLKKGQIVKLDGLVYDERGSKTLKARVQWVRPGKKGDTFEVGVHVQGPSHRSYFRALAA